MLIKIDHSWLLWPSISTNLLLFCYVLDSFARPVVGFLLCVPVNPSSSVCCKRQLVPLMCLKAGLQSAVYLRKTRKIDF